MRIIRIEMINSLEGLALNCIIKNFDAFMAVYNSTTNNFLLRCFEFLQRMYYEDLVEKVLFSENKFVSFWINPFIKKLNLSFEPHDFDTVIGRLRIAGNNITILDLRKMCVIDRIFLDLIALMPNVEELYLPMYIVPDSNLKCIGECCPSLHTFVAQSPFITMEYLIGLCKKDERDAIQKNYLMKKLDILNAKISADEILFLLSYFPALEELCHDYACIALAKAYYPHLWKNTSVSIPKFNFRKFHVVVNHASMYSPFEYEPALLNKTLMETALTACSVLCPEVSHLSVHGDITNEDLLVCADFPQLTEIQLNFIVSSSTDCGMFLQSIGHSLVKIHLDCCTLSVALLGKCCPKLETLILLRTEFRTTSEDDPNQEVLFPCLKLLRVKNGKSLIVLDEAVFSILCSSPELEFLLLEDVYISENFVAAIQNRECLVKLKKLDFSCSGPCNPAVIELIRFTSSLEHLILDGCSLFSEDYMEIIAFLKHKYYYIKSTRYWFNSFDRRINCKHYLIDDNEFFLD